MGAGGRVPCSRWFRPNLSFGISNTMCGAAGEIDLVEDKRWLLRDPSLVEIGRTCFETEPIEARVIADGHGKRRVCLSEC